MAEPHVAEPFPIHAVAHKYLLYDADTIAHVRREHHITGVLVGGLPQAPQQNVFLGIPLELMPEEARLLVEKSAAYIVDDVAAHKSAFLNNNKNGLSGPEKERFRRVLEKQGFDAAKASAKRAGEKKETALRKIAEKNSASSGEKTENWNDIPDDMFASRASRGKAKGKRGARSGTVTPVRTPIEETPPALPASSAAGGAEQEMDDEESLFAPPPRPMTKRTPSVTPSEISSTVTQPEEPYKITPTTSYPPMKPADPDSDPSTSTLPKVPSSYPLFKHLHQNGYFLAPGLRFGCQYTAYPGDPLRFHSHFLCNGMDWDEEFDLLQLVGGGRLGTGVKKGFCIGGTKTKDKTVSREEQDGSNVKSGDERVRAFCVEWAGM